MASPSSSETAAEPPTTSTKRPANPPRQASAVEDLVKPSPFPPLELMQDRSRSVSYTLAQSQLRAQEKRARKGKGKEEAVPAPSTSSSSGGGGAAQTTGKSGGKWKSNLAPGEAAKKLFPKPNVFQRAHRRFFIKRDLKYGRNWTPEELDEAAKRGNFPHRPSDLFLKMYADVLTTLTRDPLAGNVSPALIGTQGTMPLSIVSTIPDIMQHYKDCIVLAEKEVFLVTNYWQPSDSVNTIASALEELNKRVGERKGEQIIVKIMWDRGAIQQLWHNHVAVTPETWVPLGLPHPDKVPNLSIQVINFHRPLLGTFHQKAMVVDRKIALLNSNNIQDRPNLEMMVHLEGPVVDSIYDNIIISFDERFSPPLACLLSPSPTSDPSLFPYTFSDMNPYLANIDVAKAAKAARILLSRQDEKARAEEEQTSLSPPDWWRRDSTPLQPNQAHGHGHGHGAHGPGHGGQAGGEGEEGGRFAALVLQLVEKAREEKARLAMGMNQFGERGLSGVFERGQHDGTAAGGAASSRPSTSGNRPAVSSPLAAPTVLAGGGEEGRSSVADSGVEVASQREVEEKGNGAVPGGDENGLKLPGGGHDLSLAQSDPAPPGLKPDADAPPPTASALPQSPPNTTASPTIPAAATGGDSPSGSGFSQNGNGKGTASSARLAALSKALNAGAITKRDAAFEDESLIHDFKPHLLHKKHEAFPMALVNRRPHGSPGHADLRCPQDAAWLAALRYAEKNVFIQTPTLNARPLVRGIIEACTSGGPQKSGIPITLFLDLGFNDKGESIPFQGGTNEQVVFRLYAALRAVKKEGNLHVFWYTGKDQIRPWNANFKSRNCHIKFLSVDGQCGIVGNGNMDSQSFWHSQEANVLVDSPQIVSDWMDQLRTNQSTHKYGRVDTDGIWRDPVSGEELESPKKIGCWTAMRAVI
ncbi:hypothetical protein JCM8547_008811 [Rhodosporidiobolus lusitaniae]